MYYWVNQGKTYKEEKEGGYLWAPVQNKSGQSVFHWDNMTELKPNDIVLNYLKGYIVGYCIIESNFFINPQPKEFNVDVIWEDEGYMVEARYFRFSKALDIKAIYDSIKEFFPVKYSPINRTGDPPKIKANQGYLYKSNKNIVETIFKIAKISYEEDDLILNIFNEATNEYCPPNSTSRKGLITSRIGQGEYRQKVLRRWNNKCAVSGLNIKEILIASHIVPWRESNDKERLDVDNGLLLSPIYDSLFDRYFISFEDNGKIILSDSLNEDDISKLGISGKEQIKKLTDGNRNYLVRHREKLLNL